ncbi:hypothetical protein L228DRAFT_279793 [Xylona heveae TC161]|uniref:magnesium chelatase n=1 Tax=Xylona heveae (strain CBS 132557 / TC161) TaxID=1328760 RepID=A0A165JTU3_XYLHT|nr:hypothetical protein L228DRAFT_279793 [Xylona heveae TC161]KZF26619.1 hypothetical protein L228DRAFT_279793 [Xylona heveae TC161]
MDLGSLPSKVQALSDLELAILLCLIAEQHCIIEAQNDSLGALEVELRQVLWDTFGLTSVALSCSEDMTLEDFTNSVLIDDDGPDLYSSDPFRSSYHSAIAGTKFRSIRRSSQLDTPMENKKLPNVIIAKDLDLAEPHIQIQVLELIRSKRIYTRTAVHSAPKSFLICSLMPYERPRRRRLLSHLNDQMFISHSHGLEDEAPEWEETSDQHSTDQASLSSVVRKSHSSHMYEGKASTSTFSSEDINALKLPLRSLMITAEVKRYMQNIVTFLRQHRAVYGGVSARASKHLDLLVRCLATLHFQDFVTPSLVALAIRKIYPHRILIATPENERSMQWGSELDAVAALLDGVGPEDVIEDVLAAVDQPL